ncbi:hypothetical protein KIL84_013269 [Mauremys mutica]|uniref:Uncharacterized protein n=1 Tax=Mauremys mutica TaxID=74926 RepID=A0A9D3WV67_9SAUR|nr:hypothetical protein KIL84_013269 [Mauremys mutica]
MRELIECGVEEEMGSALMLRIRDPSGCPSWVLSDSFLFFPPTQLLQRLKYELQKGHKLLKLHWSRVGVWTLFAREGNGKRGSLVANRSSYHQPPLVTASEAQRKSL